MEESGKRKHSREDDHGRSRASSAIQILARISRLIVELGEPSRYSVSESVLHLGREIASIEDEDVKAGVLSTISAVVSEQPHKIPLLAAVLEIVNLSVPAFGQAVVESLHLKIQMLVTAGNWSDVKNFVRFLAALGQIVDGTGIVDFLTSLTARAVDLQKGSESRQGLAEEIYILVLLAVPFYVKSGEDDTGKLNEQRITEAEKIVTLANELEVKASQATPLLSTFFTDAQPEGAQPAPYEPQEFIVLVKAAIERVVSDKWALRSLVNTADLVRRAPDYAQLSESRKSHTFPAVNLPQELPGTDSFPTRKGYLQVYLPSPVETVPNPATYEAVLLRDISREIIQKMDFNRKEVTRQLITLDLFFAPGTFAEPGIAFDKLQDLDDGQSTWKVEDVALESVLDHLFALPSTSFPAVYFHMVLAEACQVAPQAVAPVFGRAIRFLFSNTDVLDVELFYRFLDWFAHHLSNFAFTWKWKEWIEYIDLDDFHPKKLYIKQLIEGEVRLSYAKRVAETLPEEFLPLIKHGVQEPTLEYLEEGNPYTEVVQSLTAALKRLESSATNPDVKKDDSSSAPDNGTNGDGEDQSSSESVDTVIQEITDKVTSESVGGRADDLDAKVTDILVKTICRLGSRSLSHAQNWVLRAADVLKNYVNGNQEREQEVIDSVLGYWKDQPMVGLIILGYYCENKILSALYIVERIVRDDEILLTTEGWTQLNRLVAQFSAESEKNLVAAALEGLSTKVAAGSDNEWKVRWYKGYFRALARKHAESLPELTGLASGLEVYLGQAKALKEGH